ncbi:tRNA lysidine(34) synthetase TilS [Pseudomethylobacillus aquaticus]|uniref:tRNA lysidine(34) synthetase TilS n=1 Tax=Pseudomethylobacillus aquaticus TaxID=2676064 RepID=UPI001F014B95|nr:tRNA lysidine(34) synthetase TilS [Pseudomethylobacillus aquaticus]
MSATASPDQIVSQLSGLALVEPVELQDSAQHSADLANLNQHAPHHQLRDAVQKNQSTQSTASQTAALQQQVLSFLTPYLHPQPVLTLAFSGGLDSRVLLHLLHQLRADQSFQLQAVHIHHGLNPDADAWAAFCAAECERLQVPLQIKHVQVPRDSGLGVEAAARAARYAALAEAGGDYLLLAQHEDDQAETVLLQLLRGAGLRGLAGMAAADVQRRLLRPLLNCSRASLLACAREQALDWVEDGSNADPHYDRNDWRLRLLPAIRERYPAANTTLARAARHLAEAAELLDELAMLDAGEHAQAATLPVARLTLLSEARARNLLRSWLAWHGVQPPSSVRVQQMLHQLLHARADAAIKIVLHGLDTEAWLRRYHGMIYIETNNPWQDRPLRWHGEEELALPDGGALQFLRRTGEGLSLQLLQDKILAIRFRQGGERFKPVATRPTRTLKYLLQQIELPPWQRQRLPLLYAEDSLVVVPGVGVAWDWQAQPGEPGVVVRWRCAR